MDRQIKVTDRRAIHKSTGNHDPAGKRLGDEKHSHYKVNAKMLKGDLLGEEEVENRNGIDQACKPGDEAVEPLNIEDVLVFLQGHARVDLLELGCRLVLRELLLPCGFANGRK